VSTAARRAMHDARARGEGIAISAITLVELAFLAVRNRVELTVSLEAFLADIEARLVVLPITARVCARAAALAARFPKDPADRIIAGTALAEGRTLVTADRAVIRSRAVRTIW
jgi:PIN domain nuclease of toxin-antitoxin system